LRIIPVEQIGRARFVRARSVFARVVVREPRIDRAFGKD
jgi:hypothetical protein